jgi:hypothetical protein
MIVLRVLLIDQFAKIAITHRIVLPDQQALHDQVIDQFDPHHPLHEAVIVPFVVKESM